MKRVARYPIKKDRDTDLFLYVSLDDSELSRAVEVRDRGNSGNAGSSNYCHCLSLYGNGVSLASGWYTESKATINWMGYYAIHEIGYCYQMSWDVPIIGTEPTGRLIIKTIRVRSCTPLSNERWEIVTEYGDMNIPNKEIGWYMPSWGQLFQIFQSHKGEITYTWEQTTILTLDELTDSDAICDAYETGHRDVTFSAEIDRFRSMDEIGWFDPTFRHGAGLAMAAAAENLPEIEFGNLANVVQLAGDISSALSGRPHFRMEGAKKTLQDAWLSYRYSYTTTKLDIEEMSSLLTRLDQLAKMTRDNITLRGKAEYNGRTYRYSAEVPLSTLLPEDVNNTLKQLGFGLNAAAVWDMIPYSFIVDWFLNIGDFLSRAESWQSFISLKPTNVWVSELYYPAEDRVVYTRMHGDISPIFPVSTTKSLSQRTVNFRFFDTLALFS